MSVVAPIYDINNFVDPLGQLWNLIDGKYVKNEIIPPLREVVNSHIARGRYSIGITCNNNLIDISGGVLPQECSNVKFAVNSNCGLIVVQFGHTSMLVFGYDEDHEIVVFIDNSGKYKQVGYNNVKVEINQPHNAPKINEIKLIRSGTILTHDNKIFFMGRIFYPNFNRDEIGGNLNVLATITEVAPPPFIVKDVTTWENKPVILTESGELWMYKLTWVPIESRSVKAIGVREFILLTCHSDDTLSDSITFIGFDGFAYRLRYSHEYKGFILHEIEIPFELLNSTRNLRTKKPSN